MNRRLLKSLLLSAVMTYGFSLSASAEVNVVASIKPLHSLVASVMKGVGEPHLLIDGASSPHDYAMKPSDARAIENADLVFWIGESLETFLEKPIHAGGKEAASAEMMEITGLTLLPNRDAEDFEAGHDNHDHDDDHGHDDHAHEGHDHDDDHAHEEGHEGHDHDDHAHETAEHDHDDDGHDDHAHDHGHGHDHDHGAMDAHIWLYPDNAIAMAQAISGRLSEADPANADTYAANTAALVKEIRDLAHDIHHDLEAFEDRPFIVFHDAYQYFEKAFHLEAAAPVTLNPVVKPGAKRIGEIRHVIEDTGASCVFAEPQFNPQIVSVVTEGTAARSGVLDPLGAAVDRGTEHYAGTMKALASALKDCLGASS